MCTFLVFFIFTKLEMSRTAAIIGALLFGIHPMRVESVAWITERKDVLYGFFCWHLQHATFYIYKNQPQKQNGICLPFCCLYLLIFQKVQAVTLPLTMVALDFYFNENGCLKNLNYRKITFLVDLVAYFWFH